MLHLHGYLYENVYRKNKNRKWRASGGILLYYKKELKNISTFLEKSSENIWWVKIAIGIRADREVYLAGAINSQKHCIRYNAIDMLGEQLSSFSSCDIIFTGGDLNGRVDPQYTSSWKVKMTLLFVRRLFNRQYYLNKK